MSSDSHTNIVASKTVIRSIENARFVFEENSRRDIT